MQRDGNRLVILYCDPGWRVAGGVAGMVGCRLQGDGQEGCWRGRMRELVLLYCILEQIRVDLPIGQRWYGRSTWLYIVFAINISSAWWLYRIMCWDW